MLTKMVLTNFLSFLHRTEFDFTATKYSILSETNVTNTNILKGALVIGPNASGKSNVLKGFDFLLRLIKGDGIPFGLYRCFYSDDPNIRADFEFSFSGKIVFYSISYNVQLKILQELLTIDGRTILTRNGNSGVLLLDDTPINDNQLDSDTLFLRTASFHTGRFPQEQVLRDLMDFLNNSYYIDGYNHAANFGNNIFKYAEMYGVEKLNHYLTQFNYDFSVEYGSESTGEGIVLRLASGEKSIFFKRNSFPVPVAFYTESQGNQVFADLLPQIINVIEKPGMLIIDEFGNSFHNRLSEKIVRFFMKNSSFSQLFITSHATNLISNSVFRPDQIKLVAFHAHQGSTVKRLSVFKPREAQNLEKMYLGGMFEGLPKYEDEL